MKHNRSQRAKTAQETIEIIEQKFFLNPSGQKCDLAQEIETMLNGTKLYRPVELSEMTDSDFSASFETQIEVTSEGTLEAAARILDSGNEVLCLNFASAKNPGGGFLGGSQAQEEALSRASTLVASLSSAEEYYTINRKSDDARYTDHMIYSPLVSVFRDENDVLLEQAFEVNFATAPAINRGAVAKNSPELLDSCSEVMQNRIHKLLAMCCEQKQENLVLGAWGCGVFKNDPREIAEQFRFALEGKFRGVFKKVCFAILDRSPEQTTLKAFQEVFES